MTYLVVSGVRSLWKPYPSQTRVAACMHQHLQRVRGIPKAPQHTTFILTYSLSSSYKSPLLSMRTDHTSPVTALSYADLRAQGKGDFQAAASV